MMITGCLVLAVLPGEPAAYASCATEARVSPYAFIGTVIDTAEEDRVATVITDGGRQVKVVAVPNTSWFSKSFSSVDRRYALGGRYEFHPINAESPYRDNRCTATQQLAGPSLRPLESTKEFLPDWLPVDEQAGFVGYLMFFGSLAAALGLSVIVGRKIIRRIARRGA
ncbi:MAG TPA: hypothetical protein VFO20_13470 [Propionibacteriaceae bacterium]|nr:hypothetical protein [Propionibacteriaceae bacterium]